VKPLTDFLRFVYPLARTVSEPAALNALQQAASDFCERTGYWVEELDVIPVVGGVAEYELELPPQSSLVQIAAVAFNGAILHPRTMDDLDKMYVGVDWMTARGTPRYYTQFTNELVRLVPVPDTRMNKALRVRATLAPSIDADEVPTELYERFGQDIAYGAASRLLREGGREYFNPELSVLYEQRFLQAVSTAKLNSTRSRVRAPLRVMMQRL
jgi:hypothetical protein